MFHRLASLVTRRPVTTCLAWVLLLVVAGIGTFTGFGGKGLFERLHSDTWTEPGTESAEVYDLTQSGDETGPATTVVVTGVKLKDPAQAKMLATATKDLRTRLTAVDHVATVADPFALPQNDPRAQALMSKDADGFVAVATLDANLSSEDTEAAQKEISEEVATFSRELGEDIDGAAAAPMSNGVISDAIIDQVEKDLVRGEAIGLPIALLLMVLVFGGAIAAGLPLAGALSAIVVGMFGVWGLTHTMDIDSFVLNVVSLLGLALSIDYGLLVVSRFREEAHTLLEAEGYPGDGSRLPDRATQRRIVRDAVHRTATTAGRTVSFSALTIAVAVMGLLVMRSPVLQTIGLAAILVVLLAVLASITLVPALLALLGRFLLAPSPLTRVPGLRQLFRAVGDVSTEEGVFSRLAAWVHRHPWAVLGTVASLLVVMCLPIASLSLRTNFAEYIPNGSPIKNTYDTVQAKYPVLATPDLVVVLDTPPAKAGDAVEHLKGLEGVTYVSQPAPLASDAQRTVINVKTDATDPVGELVTRHVKDLRDWDAGYQVLVGGTAAGQTDFNHSVLERAPLALGIMAAAVLVLLFLMTGSLVVPLKALVINLLSLVASLGTTWFLFQHGLLGLPQVPGMEMFVVAVAIAFGFGLAMDYEVFLLARIKEYWDTGIGNDAAVERGLQRSGRIITSAAAIIIAVFLGFVLGDMLAIKQVGVALAVVVLVDATLVRMLLVPATMTLLGRWNWWAPGWLDKIYQRFKIVH